MAQKRKEQEKKIQNARNDLLKKKNEFCKPKKQNNQRIRKNDNLHQPPIAITVSDSLLFFLFCNKPTFFLSIPKNIPIPKQFFNLRKFG